MDRRWLLVALGFSVSQGVATPLFADTSVTATKAGKTVTVNVANPAGMMTNESNIVVGTLREGCRPHSTFNAPVDYNNSVGALMMLAITPQGEICVYHKHATGHLSWRNVNVSATFSVP